MIRNSIRTQLARAFISVAIVPLLIVGVLLTLQSLSVQREQALRFQREVTLRVSTQIQAFIDRLELQLRAAVRDLHEQAPEAQREVLANLPSFPNVFQELAVLGADGRERVRLSRLELVTPGDLRDRSGTEEFNQTRATDSTYYGPITFDDAGEPSMLMAMPMRNPRTGTVDGVLVASVRFKEIWDLIAAVQVQSGENVFLVDADSRVVAHLNPSIVLRGERFRVPEDGLTVGLSDPNVVLASNTLTFGQQRFTVVAERTLLQAAVLAIQTAALSVGLIVLALIVAAMIALAVSRRIVQPIRQLASAAEALRVRSESFQRTSLDECAVRTDELGLLARTFQQMGDQIIVREQTLKLQVQELRIEIDEAKKRKAVEAIVESDTFRDLQAKAAAMRRRYNQGKTENTARTEPAAPEEAPESAAPEKQP